MKLEDVTLESLEVGIKNSRIFISQSFQDKEGMYHKLSIRINRRVTSLTTLDDYVAIWLLSCKQTLVAHIRKHYL